MFCTKLSSKSEALPPKCRQYWGTMPHMYPKTKKEIAVGSPAEVGCNDYCYDATRLCRDSRRDVTWTQPEMQRPG